MTLESKRRYWIVLSLLTFAIVADQVIKIAVKTNMQLGEGIMVFGEWFQIRFIENNGMAFGMELFGKLFLTSFRMVAVGFLIYYLASLLRTAKKPFGYVETIMREWSELGLKTKDDVAAHLESKAKKTAQNFGSDKLAKEKTYSQRVYGDLSGLFEEL